MILKLIWKFLVTPKSCMWFYKIIFISSASNFHDEFCQLKRGTPKSGMWFYKVIFISSESNFHDEFFLSFLTWSGMQFAFSQFSNVVLCESLMFLRFLTLFYSGFPFSQLSNGLQCVTCILHSLRNFTYFDRNLARNSSSFWAGEIVSKCFVCWFLASLQLLVQ